MTELPPPLAPDDYLDALTNYMAVTAGAVQQQTELLRTFGPMLSDEDRARYDASIRENSLENVKLASGYVADMATAGLWFAVRCGGRQYHLNSLGHAPGRDHYLAGITTPRGQQIVPLEGDTHLEYSLTPPVTKPPTSRYMPAV